jgi:Kef-type K+ transport system membrane component KefB
VQGEAGTLQGKGDPVVLAAAKPDEIAAIVFIDIAIIIIVARLVGALFRKIRQPVVVGEILAGIFLGPTILGAFPGDLTTRVFPLQVRPFLNVLAQLGLIIFMFIVGLELDVGLIRGKERIAAVISLASIALPFALGVLLAASIHNSHLGPENARRFVPFALFIGASMSITAFPVLARILTERRMYRTELGALTLACAAVDDILAWSLLAVVLAIVKSTGVWDLPRILVESLLFVAFMFIVVKPQLERLAKRYREVGRLSPNILAVILVGFLISAYLTSKIGIHSIFGAFVFGVIMPRKDTTDFFHEILERLEQVSVLLLLPVFFIVTGLSVNVRGLGRDALTQLPLILLVAVGGKLVGATLAARAQGLPARRAGAVGVLMNTRGLTELVILNVGKEFGILDARLFTMLVVMAVVTTIMTEPALRLVYPDRLLERDIAEAEKAALGVVDAYRVVVAVGDPARSGHLVDAAVDLLGDEAPSEVLLTRFSQAQGGLEIGSGISADLAAVASVLEGMKVLARRAEERGAKCVIRTQFSDDIGRDLVAQVQAVDGDVLLLGADLGMVNHEERAALMARLLHDAPNEVAVLVDPQGQGANVGPGNPVLVVVGEDAHTTAALELGIRIARSRGAPVELVAGDAGKRSSRRVGEWSEKLRLVGLRGEVRGLGDGRSGAGLVATGVDESSILGDTSPGQPALLVRAPPDDDGRLLERLLDRLGTDEVPAAGVAPAPSAPV